MNRVFFYAFLVFTTACGRNGDSERPLSTIPAEKARTASLQILALGDSLTAGKDLPDPEAEAYPAILEGMLKEKGYDAAVSNAGLSGDTTFDGLSRLDYSLLENPDIVLVALGSNDTFQGKKPADIEKNLDEILRRIKKKGALPVLCAMRTFPNFGPEYSAGYESLFPRLARKYGVPLVPFFLEGVAGMKDMNLPDGIHPNAQGHRKVAGNIMAVLEPILRERRTHGLSK